MAEPEDDDQRLSTNELSVSNDAALRGYDDSNHREHNNDADNNSHNDNDNDALDVLDDAAAAAAAAAAADQPHIVDIGEEENRDNRDNSYNRNSSTAAEDAASVQSIPDDTPSVQGSVVSNTSSVPRSFTSRAGLGSTSASPSPSFRPFDRRFQSRITSGSSAYTSRPSTPTSILLAATGRQGRTASISSQFPIELASSGGPGITGDVSSPLGGDTDADASSPPWEVVHWTRLRGLEAQAFSEAGRRNFGTPTCLVVGPAVVLGTTKGVVLVFDHSQSLKAIIGPGTKAIEAGAVTSLAVSSDHTTVGAGHATGSIFIWDTGRPSRPFLSISPLETIQYAAATATATADGHVPNVAVIHLAFLGTRRTALVSADDRGMAFSHLATRGTGALGRTIRTTRILGRYPDAPPLQSTTRPAKPSTVLAFASLPLGTAERASDAMGLTAMLTPYILVVVSTMPVARTQHKSARPKDVARHAAMSGCLAWFPAVKAKKADDATGIEVASAPKLVYCWSDLLTVLDVDEMPSDDKDSPPSLKFRARSRWRCGEAIVAVQWASRSVITLLTATQRLIVLEDWTMRVADGFDLLSKHIYHADLFSDQLRGMADRPSDGDGDRDGGDTSSVSTHGPIVDAFHMSFRTYRGKIYLLGFGDVSVGSLTNWHDRLVALMEHGDCVGAIRLATSYYTGDTDKITIGLPEDPALRHSLVREKMLDIMSASLRHMFKRRRRGGNMPTVSSNNDSGDNRHQEDILRDLAEACFAACQTVADTDFLFDELYDRYDEGGVGAIFLETLEPYVLEGALRTVPPTVVKATVTHYVAKGWEGRLEEMVCHLDTATLDLDQTTQLCREHGLYDALAYVWNRALGDYITPMIDLLGLLVPQSTMTRAHRSESRPKTRRKSNSDSDSDSDSSPGATSGLAPSERHNANALKIFPYLSYALTGRVYPTGEALSDEDASRAKAELYWLLFSGKTIKWPKGGGSGGARAFLTRPGRDEPSFPYLRLILEFDAPSFLSVLNEAFEDPFLNDSPEKQRAAAEAATAASAGLASGQVGQERAFGLAADRQYVVSILLEIMNPSDFALEDRIYLDMFVARNLPKFPQYLLFPGSTLMRVLEGLCDYPGADLLEDAQLSAEYLLSSYRPPDQAALIPMFRSAGFWRILKRMYSTEGQWGALVEAYFEDPEDRERVFECTDRFLRSGNGVEMGIATGTGTGTETGTTKQVQAVLSAVKRHAEDLLAMDASRTARTLAAQATEVHRDVLDAVADLPELQYAYLQALLEPEGGRVGVGVAKPPAGADGELVERYLGLMCRLEPARVSDYVGMVPSADLRLEKLLPRMEESGVVDAAVVLMAREGMVRDAMDRLVRHLDTLEGTMIRLLVEGKGKGEGPRIADVQNAAEEVLLELQKYVHVGIWLCQRQMGSSPKRADDIVRVKESEENVDPDVLSADEALWLSLIDAAVQKTRRLSVAIASATGQAAEQEQEQAGQGIDVVEEHGPRLDEQKLVSLLRSLVQHTFTSLLTSTSTPASTSAAIQAQNQSSKEKLHVGTTGTFDLPKSTNLSFLRILRTFLTRAASALPTLADLRAVLQSIFAAYAYEESILQLSTRLLERSLFTSVGRAATLRQRGWRPRGSTCEGCGGRVWGPGVAGSVYEKWEEREAGRRAEAGKNGEKEGGKGKGKGKEKRGGAGGTGVEVDVLTTGRDKRRNEGMDGNEDRDTVGGSSGAVGGSGEVGGEGGGRIGGGGRDGREGRHTARLARKKSGDVIEPLVVLACRHIYHQSCLETLQPPKGTAGYRCPIDG